MARDVESLVLQMSADVRRLEKALDQGQRKFDRTANAIEARQRALDKNLAKLGQTAGNFARPVQLAATVALGAITAFSYQAAKRAEAVNGAFEQTFRDMPEEAARAVAAISTEFGRLETDVKDNFTQLRSVVSALGVDSQTALALVDQLQRRSLDMAAFKDVSDAEAFRAVISGITGETEPLKRFGVVVNETAVKAELLRLGFKGNAQQASEAAKVIARANIILRQSGEMQGQVARESNTLAEQEKRTRAEFVKAAEDLGQKFLPVAAQLLKWASDALDAFNKLPDGVQTAGLALLALVAASGPIGAAITGLRALIAAAVAARVALAAVGGGTAAAAAGGAAAGAGAAGILLPAAAAAGVVSLRGDTPNAPAQGQERVNQQLRAEAETRQRIARLTREGNVAEATRQQQYLARVEASRRAGQAALASARPANPAADADAAASAALAGLGDFGLSDAQRNGTGGGSGGGRRAATDRTPELRAQLDLELAIATARATGDDAAIRAAEEREELARLVGQYEAAGYADAEARATSHLALLNQATALTEEREKAEAQVDIILAGRERQMEREAEYARLVNDQLMDRLGFEREIAGLIGEAGALGAAERRLWIEERTNEILRLRLALTEDEARAKAGGEFDQLRAADIIGGLGNTDANEAARAAYEEAADLREQDLLSEQEYAQRKAQIDAAYWEQRTAGTRTMLDTLASLQNSSNKKLAALGKAAAIAQATIDGVLAVQKALASAPPPLNFIQAAIVGAVAAANVASIAGMADGGLVTGPGGPREDRVLRRLSPGEFVVNARSTAQHRALLEGINRGGIPGLANGGMVGRANAASASVSGARKGSAGASLTFSPTVDARGADIAAVKRLERVLDEQSRTFANRVNGVREKRHAFKLGRRS